MALSSGTLASAIEEGTIASHNNEQGGKGSSPADIIVIPVFRVILWLVNRVKEFSPIDSLSTGRSISWEQLGLAFAQIVVFLGGIIGLFGVGVFTRRELATAQGMQ